MSRYDSVKSLIEIEREMCKLCREIGHAEHIPEIHRKYTEKIRDEMRRIDRNYRDQLAKPLTEEWRTIIDDDEDIATSGYHYRILKVENPDDWTNGDIEDYIMSAVGYPPIYEPWDCTGKRFTDWVSWSKQPAGIVMVLRWGTDL